MRIIVQNQAEEELMHKFLSAIHELGIIDLMEEEDGKENRLEQILNADDYRILSEAISGDQVSVSVEREEKELYYDEAEFITGTCTKCGEQTQGLYDAFSVTYADAIQMQSTEGQKNWRCYDCREKEGTLS